MSRYRPPLSILLGVALCVGCTGVRDRAERPSVTDPTESSRRIGLYEYMADAGLFTDCATGVRVPVAMEADNAALERAYLGAREEAGAQLLVSLMGRLEERPRTDGEGTRDFLVVTRFEQVWPAETCEKSTLSTPLENTRWKLVELGGARVQTHADQPQEVHLRFLPDEKRVAGFAGCNNVMGSYELSADGLKFGLLATTMMACPHLDEEVAFTSFLEGVGQFLILGESLVLSAESGDVARFTAVHVE